MIGQVGERIEIVARRQLGDREVAQRFEQVAAERFKIGAAAMLFADGAECRRRVVIEDRVGQLEHRAASGDAERGCDITLGYVAAERRDRGFEHPFGVAHAAASLARKQAERRLFHLNLLARGEFLQARKRGVKRDTPEVVALQARQDRLGHLLRLGGRQDELDVGGRLLERFQQRVEGLVGKLMGFVDDVDFEAVARRPVAKVFDNRARVVDLAVGRAVDFDHVERASFANFDTGRAFPARFGSRPFFAVEAAGQDARGGSFADAADAGEEEGVRDTAALQCLTERAGDVLLAHQFGEALGAPFTRQHQVR